MAKVVHRSPNVISNWERGLNTPDVEIVDQLCELFKVTPNMMYGWDTCPELEEFLSDKKRMIQELDDLLDQKEQLERQIKEYGERISRRR